jgi:kinesin family protein 1
VVKVRNTQTDMEWLWEKDKFVNRVYLMRELYEKYLEGSLEPSIFDTEADPFVDPNEPMHVGYSSVFLKSLSFCVPSEDDYAIYHDSQQTGIMHVKVEPCKPDGGVINDDEDEGNPFDMVEQPQDLLGKRLDVLVTVSSCKGLQKKVHTRDSPKFSL